MKVCSTVYVRKLLLRLLCRVRSAFFCIRLPSLCFNRICHCSLCPFRIRITFLYPAPIIVLQPDTVCHCALSGSASFFRIWFCSYSCYCSCAESVAALFCSIQICLKVYSMYRDPLPISRPKNCNQVVKDFLKKAQIIDLERWFFEIFCVFSLQSWRFCNLHLVCF